MEWMAGYSRFHEVAGLRSGGVWSACCKVRSYCGLEFPNGLRRLLLGIRPVLFLLALGVVFDLQVLGFFFQQEGTHTNHVLRELF